jgi:hypothetical protein
VKTKLVGILIAGFWTVMMVALWRVEYAERGTALDEVPVERVLRKVLSQPDPMRLNVYYLGQTVGVFRADILPVYTHSTNVLAVTESRLIGHRVQSELNLNLRFGEMPIKLRLAGDTLVNRRLALERTHLRGQFNGTKFSVRAVQTNGQMTVSYDLGQGGSARELRVDQALGAGLSQSLGLPAALLPLGQPRGATDTYTKAYFGRLNLGGRLQRVYLIETRINDALWAKLWIDEGGQLLQAQSSAGISARSDLWDADNARQSRPDHLP